MTRKLLVVLALTVLALSGAAIAEALTTTRLPAPSVNPNDEGGQRISGFVVSSRERCHNDRKVFLFKKKGRRRGLPRNPRRDRRIGFDRATPNGDGSQYRINFNGRHSGKFYTYVHKTESCSRAYSRVVTVSAEG